MSGQGTTSPAWERPGSPGHHHRQAPGTGHQALGEVLLNRTTGSIGYIVGAAHRGQRLAVRALGAMTEYAHTTVARPQAILEIEPAPIAVARSAGFRLSNSASVELLFL